MAHHREQVRILLHRLALHLRETHGDLYASLGRYGPEDTPRDYAADVRRCWMRAFKTWPKDGRLHAGP